MPKEDSELDNWYANTLRPHEAELRAWLRCNFPPELEFDDIVQESLISALRAKENGKLRSPKAFLFGAARNLALGAMRRRRVRGEDRELDYTETVVPDAALGVSETVVRNQELQILTEAIQSLPERCRQIFTLRKVYGMKQREIAKELNISTRTVNAQITVGLHRCATFVENYIREGETDEGR